MDEKGDPSNEEAPKVIKPTSKEFRKTWGFRRTTIAKREGAGDAELDSVDQQPQQQQQSLSLRRSGRQPKRTERVEEFLTTVRRRGRKTLPVSPEDPGEPTSCPVTDAETASEGSVESTSDSKGGPRASPAGSKERSASSGKAKGGDGEDDTSDSDSDGLTLKELQNRLRKKREQEPADRPLRGALSRLRKKRREEDPTESAGMEAAEKVESPPPCPQEPAAEQAASDGRERTSEGRAAPGTREEGPRGSGKRTPECEVYDPSALYCMCRQPHNNRWVLGEGLLAALGSGRSSGRRQWERLPSEVTSSRRARLGEQPVHLAMMSEALCKRALEPHAACMHCGHHWPFRALRHLGLTCPVQPGASVGGGRRGRPSSQRSQSTALVPFGGLGLVCWWEKGICSYAETNRSNGGREPGRTPAAPLGGPTQTRGSALAAVLGEGASCSSPAPLLVCPGAFFQQAWGGCGSWVVHNGTWVVRDGALMVRPELSVCVLSPLLVTPGFRFMICCDRCEEWFHGDCVGISEARGRLLERNGEDYICPNCTILQVQDEPHPEVANPREARLQPADADGTDCTSMGTIEQKSSEDQGIKGRIEKAANPSGKKKLKIFQPVGPAGWGCRGRATAQLGLYGEASRLEGLLACGVLWAPQPRRTVCGGRAGRKAVLP